MSVVIGVVNYGVAGNVHSIKKAIEAAGGQVLVINNPGDFKCVDKVVIPGVGSFRDAMNELESDGFIEPLKETMVDKPVLGICLGMQILATLGFEYGRTEGLNIIEAEVKPMLVHAKVPHMGFNKIRVVTDNALLQGLDQKEFYFMHSFEMVNYVNIAALSIYEGHQFVSSVHKESIYGVQFHPEKSRGEGIKLFQNFIGL